MEIISPIVQFKSKRPEVNYLKAEAIETFTSHGYIVVERNCDNGHILVLGGVRRVNYYPSTGTVYVDKEIGKPSIKTKGIEQAISILDKGTLLFRKKQYNKGC